MSDILLLKYKSIKASKNREKVNIFTKVNFGYGLREPKISGPSFRKFSKDLNRK